MYLNVCIHEYNRNSISLNLLSISPMRTLTLSIRVGILSVLTNTASLVPRTVQAVNAQAVFVE